MKNENFNKYNKLINECYDTIAEIVKKHSTESYYDSVLDITIYTLQIDSTNDLPELFISWIDKEMNLCRDVISKIDYTDYGNGIGSVSITTTKNYDFFVTSCLAADICELTDCLIERYG